LIAEGLTMIERGNTFGVFRDCATDLFGPHIGTSWPGTGSRMSHRNLTAG
jgi:hypothetical protein